MQPCATLPAWEIQRGFVEILKPWSSAVVKARKCCANVFLRLKSLVGLESVDSQ